MMSLYIAMVFRFQWIYLKEQCNSLKCQYLQYTGNYIFHNYLNVWETF